MEKEKIMLRKTLLFLAVPLLLAACGKPSTSSGAAVTAPDPYASSTASQSAVTSATLSAPPTTARTAAPAVAPPSVLVAQNMALGPILVNRHGRTLYYFVPERGGQIVCSGACTGVWPPSFTGSQAPTASGSLPGRVAAIARSGGEQVTYNRWPLYTYAGDLGPDQARGQGVFGFGGKWFVATPALQS